MLLRCRPAGHGTPRLAALGLAAALCLAGGCRTPPPSTLPIVDPLGQVLTLASLTGQDDYVTSLRPYLEAAKKPYPALGRTASTLSVVRTVFSDVHGNGPDGIHNDWSVVVAYPLIVGVDAGAALEEQCVGVEIEVDTQEANMPALAPGDVVFVPNGLVAAAWTQVDGDFAWLPWYHYDGVEITDGSEPQAIVDASDHPPSIRILAIGGTAVERVRVTVPITPIETPIPSATWRGRHGDDEEAGCLPPPSAT